MLREVCDTHITTGQREDKSGGKWEGETDSSSNRLTVNNFVEFRREHLFYIFFKKYFMNFIEILVHETQEQELFLMETLHRNLRDRTSKLVIFLR